ncbi:MAG: hypothetical protein HN341_18120 [Verrucomicrobia bacterium]|nr:hypothetical protein [Verrucomicrobiota bacterium]
MKQELYALFALTYIVPEKLRDVCRDCTGKHHLEAHEVGLPLFGRAVIDILSSHNFHDGESEHASRQATPLPKERILELTRACEAALKDSHQTVETMLRGIQIHGVKHPQGWQLLSSLAGRALRGELCDDHHHPEYEEAEENLLLYLDPNRPAGSMWQDAWDKQRKLLKLEH